MTDNKVLILEDGREGVFCNRADGLAIKEIKKLGICQIILSTEKNPIIKYRAKKLQLPFFNNIGDKKKLLINYCKRNKYSLKKTVFIGNDINDLESMRIVGFPVAPFDADLTVKKIAKLVIKKKGGGGVIREFYKKLL